MVNLFNNIIFIFNPINVRLDNYLKTYIKDNRLINLLKICIISDLAISLTFLGAFFTIFILWTNLIC